MTEIPIAMYTIIFQAFDFASTSPSNAAILMFISIIHRVSILVLVESISATKIYNVNIGYKIVSILVFVDYALQLYVHIDILLFDA